MKLEVRGGSFGYPGGPPLLRGVSFQVEGGEVLSILGPNGAGKTTLLRCMLGLLNWKEGQTLLDGQPLANDTRRWQSIGYVPQQKRPALGCTALEMVLLGRSPHLGLLAQPTARDEALAWECLERVGAEALANRLCSQLSGGEYQLVLFARALAVQPRFLVLDEPEANLDFKNQQKVLEVLERLCRQEGLGVLWITHSPQNALALADKALLLNRQGEYRFGPAEEALTEENLSWCLEMPLKLCRVQAGEKQGWCVLPLGSREKG